MKKLIHLSRTLALLGSLVGPAAAQAGEWSPSFDRPGLLGRVFALGRDGTDLVAGGYTFQADGQFMEHVARWDGTAWSPYGDGVGGTVRAFTEFQGQLVAGGEFYAANGPNTGGASVVHSVARWDGQRWQPMGGGLELSWGTATVWDLEIFQGELYAGGQFDLASGQAVTGIARWDGLQWQPVGGGIAGSNEPKVLDMTVTSTGELVVVGEFDSAGGVAAQNVASWNGTSWSALGSGLGVWHSSVFAVTEFQGRIYAGGTFTSSGATLLDKIASYNGTSWEDVGGGIPDWDISSTVYSLQEVGGVLYVGGNFDQAGSVASRAVARWTGSAWEGVGGIGGSDIATTAIALTEWNGQLVVGGEFEYGGDPLAVGQVVVSTSVIAYDGSAWSQLGAGLGLDDRVSDLLEYDGGVVAVGNFLTAGGSLAPRVAFFDGTDWRDLGYFNNGNVGDAFLWQGDLVVTGNFQNVNGQPIRYIARWDGVQWNPMGNASGGDTHVVYQGELYAGGYDLRKWNGSSWDLVGDVPGTINELHVHDDGKLYLAGNFPSYASPHIASWDGTTVAPLPAGLPFEADSLTSFQGDLVAGLRTDFMAGQVGVVQRFDGSTWTELDPSFNGSLCSALTVFQGDLYAAGDLILFSGDPRDWIARWNGTGWEALGSGLNGTSFTFLGNEATGRLWVGGMFTRANGMPSWSLAEWYVAPVEVGTRFCTADTGAIPCPCANAGGPGEGCANLDGSGALLAAFGTTGVQADDLTFRAGQLPPGKAALIFQGTNQLNAGAGVLFGDGVRCVGGSVTRLRVLFADANGEITFGPGLAERGGWSSGETRHFQVYYRNDGAGACGTGFNTSPAISVTFTP